MTSAQGIGKKTHFCTEQAPGGSRDESDALFTHFSIRGNCWYLVDLACQSIKSQQRKSRGAAGWWWEWSLSCGSFMERMMAEKTVWSFGDACCELARGSTVFLLHVTKIFLSWRKRQQLIGKASTCARVQGKQNRTQNRPCPQADMVQMLTQLNLWITSLVCAYVCHTLSLSPIFWSLDYRIICVCVCV